MAIDRFNEPDRDVDPMLWDEVESSRGDTSWGVDDLGWDDLAPALPAEADTALLPLERPRWSSREASATYAACAPRFLAPAPPRSRSRRPGRRVRTS
jgi:hypothetical protein